MIRIIKVWLRLRDQVIMGIGGSHGVCCKPGSDNPNCVNNDKHICSNPVAEIDTPKRFQSILTNGLNYQMFAYCPKTNPNTCGISQDQSEDSDMNVIALPEPKTISANLKYKEGRPPIRYYDSCFYMIKAGPLEAYKNVKKVLGRKLYLQVTKSTEMNIYLYGGKDKQDAIIPIVFGNQQVKVGSNYTISVSEGMMLVAYPNKDKEAEIEFKIWIADLSGGIVERVIDLNFNGQDGQMVLIGVVSAVIFAILFLCCICCCIKKCFTPQKAAIGIIEVYDEELNVLHNNNGHKSQVNFDAKVPDAAADTSMLVQDIGNEDFEVNSSRANHKRASVKGGPKIEFFGQENVPLSGNEKRKQKINIATQKYPR